MDTIRSGGDLFNDTWRCGDVEGLTMKNCDACDSSGIKISKDYVLECLVISACPMCDDDALIGKFPTRALGKSYADELTKKIWKKAQSEQRDKDVKIANKIGVMFEGWHDYDGSFAAEKIAELIRSQDMENWGGNNSFGAERAR